MNKDLMKMALLFPFLAVLTVILYAGGLGVIFIVVNETAVGEWGVIVIGLALVVGVPTVAALLQRVAERR